MLTGFGIIRWIMAARASVHRLHSPEPLIGCPALRLVPAAAMARPKSLRHLPQTLTATVQVSPRCLHTEYSPRWEIDADISEEVDKREVLDSGASQRTLVLLAPLTPHRSIRPRLVRRGTNLTNTMVNIRFFNIFTAIFCAIGTFTPVFDVLNSMLTSISQAPFYSVTIGE